MKHHAFKRVSFSIYLLPQATQIINSLEANDQLRYKNIMTKIANEINKYNQSNNPISIYYNFNIFDVDDFYDSTHFNKKGQSKLAKLFIENTKRIKL